MKKSFLRLALSGPHSFRPRTGGIPHLCDDGATRLAGAPIAERCLPVAEGFNPRIAYARGNTSRSDVCRKARVAHTSVAPRRSPFPQQPGVETGLKPPAYRQASPRDGRGLPCVIVFAPETLRPNPRIERRLDHGLHRWTRILETAHRVNLRSCASASVSVSIREIRGPQSGFQAKSCQRRSRENERRNNPSRNSGILSVARQIALRSRWTLVGAVRHETNVSPRKASILCKTRRREPGFRDLPLRPLCIMCIIQAGHPRLPPLRANERVDARCLPVRTAHRAPPGPCLHLGGRPLSVQISPTSVRKPCRSVRKVRKSFDKLRTFGSTGVWISSASHDSPIGRLAFPGVLFAH
jgi:hypothetical protein